VGADGHHRRRAVAEQAAGDDVRHGAVLLLVGQGAEFHRQQDGDAVGMGAQVVAEQRQARGPSGAAVAEQRDAPDVRPQPHPLGQPGFQGGHGQAARLARGSGPRAISMRATVRNTRHQRRSAAGG
jgi:hypothetical protein